MKKIFLSLTVASAMLFVACDDKKEGEEGDKKEGDEKEQVEDEVNTYSVDTEASYIAWENWAAGAREDHGHHGKVKLAAGDVTVTNGELSAGSVSVDISSLFDSDLTPETGLGNLIGHLSSPDFFSVDSTGAGAPSFSFSSYADGVMTGTLTIAGASQTVEIPATVSTEGGVTITSETFPLDFTQYGMPYFEQEKDMSGEEQVVILNPEVEFSIHVVAK